MAALPGQTLKERRYKGTSVCRGVAVGKPYFLSGLESDQEAMKADGAKSIDGNSEIRRYRAALASSRRDIDRLRQQMQTEKITQGVSILEAHLQILDDPLITTEIERAIQESGKSAEATFQATLERLKKHFDAMQDAFFRERYTDIEDVGRRILGHLTYGKRASLTNLPEGSIVFAKDLSASDVAEAHPERVLAFVTEKGGTATHAAIVAKAKGIPYISRIQLESLLCQGADRVIVDGRTGELIVNPSIDTLAVYRHIERQLKDHYNELQRSSEQKTETYDGLFIRLSANVEGLDEIALLHQYGGSGIGLLRTENIFLFSDTFPSEEEQVAIYRSFIDELAGLSITIRTFDIGGDKSFMGRIEGSDEPFFVGCRAIRFLLQERSIFKRQLRAILRASVGATLRLLLPMVSSLPELHTAKELLEEAKKELSAEGLDHQTELQLGCMIEVPSAALISDILAKECDFLAIGTNDLVHYSLAEDRSFQPLAPFYAQCHPCLLRLIKMVIFEANLNNIKVSICGEIASDPRFTALLLGLGVHELSVACRYLPLIKNAIRQTSAIDAVKLAEEALSLGTSQEVQQLLTQAYLSLAPEDCFYNF